MKRFKSGIYPVIPGLNIRLGDYGYWQDSQWCGLGNICEIAGCPQSFTETVSEGNHEVEEFLGVEISSGIDANTEAVGAEATLKIQFNSHNSHYLKFRQRKIREYRSIEGEILPFLLQLRDAGRWNPKYYVAYYVLESDKFFSLRSKNIGSSVCVDTSLNLSEVKTEASLKAALHLSHSSIDSVTYVGEEPKFVGAKFISLEEKGFFKKTPTIKFNQGSISQIEY